MANAAGQDSEGNQVTEGVDLDTENLGILAALGSPGNLTVVHITDTAAQEQDHRRPYMTLGTRTDAAYGTQQRNISKNNGNIPETDKILAQGRILQHEMVHPV